MTAREEASPAAIYHASLWRISHRAPLIGEHKVEILCGELGAASGVDAAGGVRGDATILVIRAMEQTL